MAAPSRFLPRRVLSVEEAARCVCRRPVARYFSSSPPAWSGHSKWATIKHDKAKADNVKNKQRTIIAKDITNAVKISGPNPNTNPRLALALQIAKKAGVPKANIEGAIARGQGISTSGAALESVTLEAILPPSVATIIDCQTDNKLRTLADLRLLVKDMGGNVTPIGYLFEKKGRVVFRKKEGMTLETNEEILDVAMECEVLDIDEDEEGRIVCFTPPAQTKVIAESITEKLGLEIEETEIVYDANPETRVSLDDEEAAQILSKFLGKLEEVPGVQGIYLNWTKGSIPDELWSELQSKADL
ncbi:DUF28-domain-containing protein [Delitschia confertaspora ATCC 74209]|uniref:DUF28-domain-containing protein n=1 Tax=Delitschia confertaspora ATCC 74209 TaxID=1513339 RepID=A0A9P4JS60_9PLEO|nr:DUF28-domain-containing protein [Delitschia confertaspora ATCC 74209]